MTDTLDLPQPSHNVDGRSGSLQPGHEQVATLREVTQRYRTVVALDGVDLDIPAHKMIGLIGPDGVGKSTLLGIIAGVRRLQAGKVAVLGGDIADARFRNSVFARVAYMPQGLGKNLYPTLSIFENVDFFGRLFGQSREEREWRIRELFASTDLTSFRDRPAGKLSGGMKQKLGLCCSLIPGRRTRMRSINSQNCRRANGSTPVVGSSRINRSGS